MSLSAHAIVVALLSTALHPTGIATAITSAGHPFWDVITGGHAVSGADAAPWFGTWQLEPPKTAPRWFEAPPYKKVTITIEPSREPSGRAPAEIPTQKLRVTYDMVRTRGGVTHMEWDGRFDGKDYPVDGLAYFLTNAYRQLDERSYEIVIKREGATAAIAMAIVSGDGSTMTVTTVETEGAKSTAVYRRQ